MNQSPDTDNEHVRELLAELGREPAPADVVARLDRVLDAALPSAPVAAPRRRPFSGVRRGLLAALPVAAIVAGVLVVTRGPSDDQAAEKAAPVSSAVAETAAAAADAQMAAPASSGPVASAPLEFATTEPSLDAFRRAGADAYIEARRLLLGTAAAP
jgi:hypothetical protein